MTDLRERCLTTAIARSVDINRLIMMQIRLCVRDIHTYHSRFIPEGVAEASTIFLRDAHDIPKLFRYEE
jgi:hypothetical protein